MLNLLLNNLKYNDKFDYNVLKQENEINFFFDNSKGIIQKCVVNNNIIGYFIAIPINCEYLCEKYGNIDNDSSYIFTYFQNINNKIPKNYFKIYSKRYSYIKGSRILFNRFSTNKNISDLKNDNFFNFFLNYFNKNLKGNENVYIINNVLNQANEFDNRLKRYYKNKIVLTYTKNLT